MDVGICSKFPPGKSADKNRAINKIVDILNSFLNDICIYSRYKIIEFYTFLINESINVSNSYHL